MPTYYRHKDTGGIFEWSFVNQCFVGVDHTRPASLSKQEASETLIPIESTLASLGPALVPSSTAGDQVFVPGTPTIPSQDSRGYTTRPRGQTASSNDSNPGAPPSTVNQGQAGLPSPPARRFSSTPSTVESIGELSSAFAATSLDPGRDVPSSQVSGRPSSQHSYRSRGSRGSSGSLAQPTRGRPLGKILLNVDPNQHEVLDERYRRRRRKFFKRGRVFKVYWHEPAGGDDEGTTVTSDNQEHLQSATTRDSRFRQKIHSKIRWFVSVRNNAQNCVCVPIVTYRGQGVSKTGVVKSEHAIAFILGTVPEPAPGEEPGRDETPMRHPIRIQPDQPGDKLVPMSRIDYSRVYTVQHNVKAMPFGYVHERSEKDFFYSFEAVFFGRSDEDEDISSERDSGEDEDDGSDTEGPAEQDPSIQGTIPDSALPSGPQSQSLSSPQGSYLERSGAGMYRLMQSPPLWSTVVQQHTSSQESQNQDLQYRHQRQQQYAQYQQQQYAEQQQQQRQQEQQQRQYQQRENPYTSQQSQLQPPQQGAQYSEQRTQGSQTGSQYSPQPQPTSQYSQAQRTSYEQQQLPRQPSQPQELPPQQMRDQEMQRQQQIVQQESYRQQQQQSQSSFEAPKSRGKRPEDGSKSSRGQPSSRRSKR